MTFLIVNLSTFSGNVGNTPEHSTHVVAGKDLDEAEDLKLKFYLGKPCRAGHIAASNREPIPKGSLRYRSHGDCVQCRKIRGRTATAAKAGYNKAEDIKQSKARHSLDDRRMAKEMGITVAELLGE